jgi:dihydroorotate dehydrogenase
VLFKLPPELAHKVSLLGLEALSRLLFLSRENASWAKQPRKVMGLTFPNSVGLAAGLDKNGDYVNALGGLGFGFIEVGTVTPCAQPGNDKPRLFRVPKARGLINKMGFNNKGVEHLVSEVKNRSYQGVLGINIGKNAATPIEDATQDYLMGLQGVYSVADYITINISSPNTPGLRDLQHTDRLKSLLSALKLKQEKLAQEMSRYVPLVIKVAPDLEDNDIVAIADTLNTLHIDGLIATNTTSSREGVEGLRYGEEQGGLSGRPVFDKSTEVLRKFHAALDPDIALIAAGGIFSRSDMQKKLDAGAELVQIYTGLVYRGPGLVKSLLKKV